MRNFQDVILGGAGSTAGYASNIHEFTLGTNYYFYGHRAKLSVDGTYLPNGSGSAGDGAADILANKDANEFVFRCQFQLLI